MRTTERMIFRLPDAYSKDTDSKLFNLLFVPGRELDSIFDTAEKIQLWHDIDNARGKTLDLIGTNVQELRGGKDDIEYRKFLKLRIIINLSGGEIPTFNEVMPVLMGDAYLGIREGWNDPDHNEEACLILSYDNCKLFQGVDKEYEEAEIDYHYFDGQYYFDGSLKFDSGKGETEFISEVLAVVEEIRSLAKELKAGGVRLRFEIPRSPITRIEIKNEAMTGIEANVVNEVDLEQEAILDVQKEVEQSTLNRFNGVTRFDGEYKFDAERDFIVHDVEVEEVA